MRHDLKIEQHFLIHILEGKKRFEVRLNDRDYQVGDTISFFPLETKRYDVYQTESPIPNFKITYVNHGFGMKENYVVLGIERVTPPQHGGEQ